MNIDITVILNQLLILFIMMLLGALLNKTGIMDSAFNKKLTKILLNITMPALIIHSVLSQTGERDTNAVLTMFAISIVVYLILPVIAWLYVKICRVPLSEQGLYMLMTVYSNVGFMGFPLLDALFGATAVFYGAIFNMIFNLSIYTLGIAMMSYGTKKRFQLNLHFLCNPGVLSSVVGIIIYFFKISFPAPVISALDSIGSLTVPLAMMMIGATLAMMNPKELFDDWHIYLYTIFRQILLPIAAIAVLRIFVHDEFLMSMSAILMMMPIANTAVLYANEYDGNAKLAAKGVFFTTLSAVVTIPLLVHICF